MNFLSDFSSFKIKKKDKDFISLSLKKFRDSPLSQISKKELVEAKKICRSIKKSHHKIFIFAFGGAGSSAKIINSLFPQKNENVFLIDAVNEETLNYISSLRKTELKSCHSIFISKSGQTKEILFYKSLLKKVYLKKQLSLKGRVTILTQSPRSPLLQWAKKEEGSIVISNNPLPGRFSFFTLSGLLQSQVYDYTFKVTTDKNTSEIVKTLEFFLYHYDKRKEIFFCPFDPQLKELAHWLELSWSESLFKKEALKQAPLLRNIALSDLRHACIEELIAKKDKICFWAFSVKSKNKSVSLHKKRVKNLLKIKKIPYIFMELSLNNKNFLSELMVNFYKILFCMGDFSKSNIYTQPWVDYLKRV